MLLGRLSCVPCVWNVASVFLLTLRNPPKASSSLLSTTCAGARNHKRRRQRAVTRHVSGLPGCPLPRSSAPQSIRPHGSERKDRCQTHLVGPGAVAAHPVVSVRGGGVEVEDEEQVAALGHNDLVAAAHLADPLVRRAHKAKRLLQVHHGTVKRVEAPALRCAGEERQGAPSARARLARNRGRRLCRLGAAGGPAGKPLAPPLTGSGGCPSRRGPSGGGTCPATRRCLHRTHAQKVAREPAGRPRKQHRPRPCERGTRASPAPHSAPAHLARSGRWTGRTSRPAGSQSTRGAQTRCP